MSPYRLPVSLWPRAIHVLLPEMLMLCFSIAAAAVAAESHTAVL